MAVVPIAAAEITIVVAAKVSIDQVVNRELVNCLATSGVAPRCAVQRCGWPCGRSRIGVVVVRVQRIS